MVRFGNRFPGNKVLRENPAIILNNEYEGEGEGEGEVKGWDGMGPSR